MTNTVWMEVTKDKYSLPIRIADSAKELAYMVGVKPETISSEASRFKRGILKTARYIRVDIDDETERMLMNESGANRC